MYSQLYNTTFIFGRGKTRKFPSFFVCLSKPAGWHYFPSRAIVQSSVFTLVRVKAPLDVRSKANLCHFFPQTMQAKVEILAVLLGVICLAGTIAITALPTWKVTAFIGANLIVMEELQEGLWMNCIRHANFRMQCKAYDSVLILPGDLQAGRGLMCLSIILIIFAIILMSCGLKQSSLCQDNMKKKNSVLAAGGSLYLVSFLTTLIPVCWASHSIITDFYNPTLGDSQKRELGSALYIGWATSVLLLITGVILLTRCSKRKTPEEQYYAEEERNFQDKNSISFTKTPSSIHKNQVYV